MVQIRCARLVAGVSCLLAASSISLVEAWSSPASASIRGQRYLPLRRGVRASPSPKMASNSGMEWGTLDKTRRRTVAGVASSLAAAWAICSPLLGWANTARAEQPTEEYTIAFNVTGGALGIKLQASSSPSTEISCRRCEFAAAREESNKRSRRTPRPSNDSPPDCRSCAIPPRRLLGTHKCPSSPSRA